MDATTELIIEGQSDRGLIQPVILSGGQGTRLWPMSRACLPKQFLSLSSDRTLLQDTATRTAGDANFGAPIIVCNAVHREIAGTQLSAVGIEARNYVVEPVGRDTAPAVATAALILIAAEPDAVMLVQPADHRIAGARQLRQSVGRALDAATDGRIVIFGVPVRDGESRQDRIRRGAALPGSKHVYDIDRLVGKPGYAHGEGSVGDGEYFRDSGIVLCSARRYLEELETFQPELFRMCTDAVEHAAVYGETWCLDMDAFARLPSMSMNCAVVDRTSAAVVTPLHGDWDDVDSWLALRDSASPDCDGNVMIGDVELQDVFNSYVRSERGLLAAVGLSDVVMVSTGDAVLVASVDGVSNIGSIVERLKRDSRRETERNRGESRPWGRFETVDSGHRYQVKQIVVRPGGRLSLQLHRHRSEHWVVVSGTARVVCGDTERYVCENESVYIPPGAPHRLENPGKIPLTVVEVQCGSYLGEDDIVRLEDVYGRN